MPDMEKSYKTEFTNMVMIRRDDGMVLVQERKLYWKGIAFPGGHAEPGESFERSAEREILEETGLTVKNLELCGTVHWECPERKEKYVVFLYRTSDFSGELISETEEGKVFWVKEDELKNMKLCSNFEKYLELFTCDVVTEFHAVYK